eukprot:TRINITY_DN55616_c0_g1_i1.p1 TRINITY_DN55616_c0_g1~~TRINITY_DN55616_c0_g1_i1.p1  ORF type:complete len:220 (+),score=19.52 TRINITY_DN55616_c0_g1_i1:49-708(+)
MQHPPDDVLHAIFDFLPVGVDARGEYYSRGRPLPVFGQVCQQWFRCIVQNCARRETTLYMFARLCLSFPTDLVTTTVTAVNHHELKDDVQYFEDDPYGDEDVRASVHTLKVYDKPHVVHLLVAMVEHDIEYADVYPTEQAANYALQYKALPELQKDLRDDEGVLCLRNHIEQVSVDRERHCRGQYEASVEGIDKASAWFVRSCTVGEGLLGVVSQKAKN